MTHHNKLTVITQLAGGLGNQMFQYAFAYALSKKLDMQLEVDTSFLETPGDGTYTQRALELNCFSLPLAVADKDKVSRAKKQDKWFGKWRARLNGEPLFQTILETPDFNMLHLPRNCSLYLKGYWQSEDYFKAYRNDLLKWFKPKTNIDNKNAASLKWINDQPTASIHVRRGDYVSNPSANRFHGICGPEYYLRASQMLHEQYGISQFMVFSDEPDWVRQNIHLPYYVKYVTDNTGKEAHWDLFLMKHCKHNIIANSSFSWWGAWLNEFESKVVIAPKHWFAIEKKLAAEIVPSSWIRI